MLGPTLLTLLLCHSGRVQAQVIREWKADVNPADWWQDSAWSSEWPKYGNSAWFYPDGDNPTRSAHLDLPDVDLTGWQEIDRILADNFRYRIIGGANPLTYILGDLDVVSRGDQGQYSQHYMMNAGFINALGYNSGGGPYTQRFGSRAYGLETANVRVGLNHQSRGIARNDGIWHIGGQLSIGQYSQFTSQGTTVVSASTNLQNWAELNVRRGLFNAGNFSITGTDSQVIIGERIEGRSSAKLVARTSLVAPGTLYVRGGATLEVEENLAVTRFDTDQARDPSTIYGNIIRAGTTFVGGTSGTMELGRYDSFSTSSLELGAGSKFDATGSVVNISGTATVGGGSQFWATNSSLNVGTLSVGGSASLIGKTFQNGSSPDIVLGQLGVSGHTDLRGWTRAGSLSASSSGTIRILENSRLELTGSAAVAGNGKLSASGSNAFLTGTEMRLTGGTTGGSTSLAVEDGAIAAFSGTLSTQSATGGGSSRITVSGLGRLEAERMEFGMTGGTNTELVIADGGTVTATEGMNVNHGHFTDNVSTIVYGGPDGNGGYRNPGLLVTPYVTKASENGVMTMRFQHRGTGTLFWPKLENLGIIESTGPGRTVLRGQLMNDGVIRADMGALEINHGEAPNTLVLGTQVRGGNLVVKGSQLLVNPAGLSGSSVTAGTLSVTEGGFLRSAVTISGADDNTPSVLVEGQYSCLLAQKDFTQIGYTGKGALNIVNGGLVICDPATNNAARIGGTAAGRGNVYVNGGASEWRVGHVSVGYEGSGGLGIGSGVVRGHNGNPAASIYVGDRPGSFGMVDMSGNGRLAVQELRIGNQGGGLLEIKDTSLVRASGPTTVGHSGAGNGSIRILGNGKLYADGGLSVGANGSESSLVLRRGGTAQVGADGHGILTLGSNSSLILSNYDDEGEAGPEVGKLLASRVVVGAGGKINFSHSRPDYLFEPAIVGSPIIDVGAEGTTHMTEDISVGGINVVGGTLILNTCENEYGNTTIGTDYGDHAWLHVSYLLNGGGFRIRGGIADTGLRIDGQGFLDVGHGTGEVLMGRAPGTNGTSDPGMGGGTIVFGGTGGGRIEAAAIRGLGTQAAFGGGTIAPRVVFSHSAARHEFSTPLRGTVSLVHEGPGTTVIPETMDHSGGTTVTGGRLILNASGGGSATSTASNTGTLGGTGTVTDLVIENGGTLAPGDPTAGGNRVGRFRSTRIAHFRSGGKFEVEIADWSGTIGGTHWDQLQVSQMTMIATAENPFVIKVTGPTANFTETGKTITIVTRTGGATIPNPQNVIVDGVDFPGTGTWTVSRLTSALRLIYTPGTETPYEQWARLAGLTEGNDAPTNDADKDGLNNLAEFAMDGNPLGGAADGKRAFAVQMLSGTSQVMLTLPVRQGAVFSGSSALVSGVESGVIYRIEAGDDLSTWTVPVIEVTGTEAQVARVGLPPLSNANWTYRTFRTSGAAPMGRRFIRAGISSP